MTTRIVFHESLIDACKYSRDQEFSYGFFPIDPKETEPKVRRHKYVDYDGNGWKSMAKICRCDPSNWGEDE